MLLVSMPSTTPGNAQIATLKAHLTDEPDFVIAQQGGRTHWNITEGAIASLLATAVQPTVWHGRSRQGRLCFPTRGCPDTTLP
jgi:hypothetical protein